VKDWRSGGGVVVQSIVERMLEVAAPHDAALLTIVLAEPQRATPAQLTELAGRGLFVDVVEGRPLLNPVVAAVVATSLARACTATTRRTEIQRCSGCSVRFDDGPRNRSALQPASRPADHRVLGARAGRPCDARRAVRHLLARADRDSRSQGLRTACSMIRSAIARCAGRESVDRYFRVADGWVSLSVEHVTCDCTRSKRRSRARRKRTRRR